MTEGANDRLEVRIFTLADHVATPPDGKMYISGGGVDQMFLTQIPGVLGPLALAVRLRVPWHMTSERISVQVRVLSADRAPLGPDPAMRADIEVGRPPGTRPGDEIGVGLAVPLTGFPVEEEGSIFFHLIVNDTTLSVLPLKVQRALIAQIGPLASP